MTPSTRPTVADIQERVGMVSRTLFAVPDLTIELPNGDSPASHFGTLAGLLAEQLDRVFDDLDEWTEGEP